MISFGFLDRICGQSRAEKADCTGTEPQNKGQLHLDVHESVLSVYQLPMQSGFE